MIKIEVPAYLFRGTAVILNKNQIKNATDNEFEHVNLYITKDQAEYLRCLADKAQNDVKEERNYE